MSHMDGIYEPHWQIGLAPLPIGKCPMGKTKRPMTKNHMPHEEIKTPHGFCGDTPFAFDGGAGHERRGGAMMRGEEGTMRRLSVSGLGKPDFGTSGIS